jgi:hypothetical protein
MGNPFKKPKAIAPNDDQKKAAEAARLAKQKQAAEQQEMNDKAAEEEAARLRRLRGARSLLGGGFTGFGIGGNSTLG